jgi:hypothetical protein
MLGIAVKPSVLPSKQSGEPSGVDHPSCSDRSSNPQRLKVNGLEATILQANAEDFGWADDLNT